MVPHLRGLALAFTLSLLSSSAFAGKLHTFTSGAAGFFTHSLWYDDGKEVTVIDTQFTPSDAEALLTDIKKRTASPVTRVIVTHPNPDKFNALSVFHKAGAESISSKRTSASMPGVDAYKRYFFIEIAKALTADTYPKMEPVKTTFDEEMVLTLQSGETITLFELGKPGISSNQTVVRIDQSGDLVVGDLIATDNHAWLEGGIVDGKPVATLESWKENLARLPELGTGRAFGGRGHFVAIKQAVAQQTAYLEKADTIVDDYITMLGNKKTELSEPTKQGMHYAAIQAKFVEAFPSYAMPDLVGFSVYGLVQQKLAK